MENKKTFFEALMEFQRKSQDIRLKKDVKNNFKNYSYADLQQVLEEVKPLLTECGLLLVQAVVDGGKSLSTTINLTYTPDGKESLGMNFPLIHDQTMQSLGAAVTYARRYSLITLLGLAAEDDDGDKATTATTHKPKDNVVVENLVERAEKLAERAKVANPVADKITGVYIDATGKTGTSAKGPWTKTTYIVDVNGQKQFIAVFGPKKDCKAGDVLIFTDVENGTYGRTANKVEKEQPPASNDLVEAENLPF